MKKVRDESCTLRLRSPKRAAADNVRQLDREGEICFDKALTTATLTCIAFSPESDSGVSLPKENDIPGSIHPRLVYMNAVFLKSGIIHLCLRI